MKNIVLSFLAAGLFISVHAEKNLELTVEKIWLKGTFSQKSVHGLTSTKDGLHYTVLEEKNGQQQINKYTYEHGKLVSSLLKTDIKDDKGGKIEIESYSLSDDEKMILLTTGSEKIYRHSMKSDYYVFTIADQSWKRIGSDKFQLGQFSPDGKFISYVRDNNLYIYDWIAGKETAVTTDGKWNFIINGAPDWVYEEEFVLVKAYAWSPDSKYLAYYRFDESVVREFSFPMYTGLYPENYVYKYPKAGEKNAKVDIYIYDAASGKAVKVKLDNYEYVPRITWTNKANILSVQLMNRLQNHQRFLFANATSGETALVMEEKTKTYFEVQDVEFLQKQDAFLFLSENTGFNQLYLCKYKNNGKGYEISEKMALSANNSEVANIIGMNEAKGLIYYQVFDEKNAANKMIMVHNLSKKQSQEFTLPDGSNTLKASSNMQYFINYNSAHDRPLSVQLFNASGKKIRTLEDNKVLNDTIANYYMGNKEFFRFKNNEGIELLGWMIKPDFFDNTKKYPVLMFVYGGPGSQTVTNGWGGSNDLWFRYLANKGYLVVSIDNRGTGGRGRDFRACTYEQLGKFESEDQIAGAKHLAGLSYVDKSRIGIWGWSYGGYMSTLCLAKGNDVFKMAIAVAPVTNWRFYDSIYTERYMGLPADNGKGYDDNSPINHVDKIKGKYLLVHGTADDNVHFQNTTELIDALIKNNVQFDLAVYPDKNHGIYGGNTRYHLFTKMTDFVLENL